MSSVVIKRRGRRNCLEVEVRLSRLERCDVSFSFCFGGVLCWSLQNRTHRLKTSFSGSSCFWFGKPRHLRLKTLDNQASCEFGWSRLHGHQWAGGGGGKGCEEGCDPSGSGIKGWAILKSLKGRVSMKIPYVSSIALC